jgi:HSP20 family molecular chaperone IbpA
MFDEQFDVPPLRGLGDDGMRRREDAGHLYYDVPIEGLKKEDLKIKVGEGMISISGKYERENFISRFDRSFAIPDGVDPASARIEVHEDRLVLEFRKKYKLPP